MTEQQQQPYFLPFRIFLKRLSRNLLIGVILSACSLFIGMLGYHHFEKMSWIDAYVNAAMILSGMGPVSTLQTDEGKIFAGSYALFSGIIFLVIIAVIFAPVFHRFFHKFRLEEAKRRGEI
jgi:hypothetical protein